MKIDIRDTKKIEKESFIVNCMLTNIAIKIILVDVKGDEVRLLGERHLGFPEFEMLEKLNLSRDFDMKIEELREVNKETYDHDWDEKYDMPNLNYKVTLYEK